LVEVNADAITSVDLSKIDSSARLLTLALLSLHQNLRASESENLQISQKTLNKLKQ